MSGKPVFLLGAVEYGPLLIPMVIGGFWHATRVWKGSVTRFVDTGWWKVIDAAAKVPFEPVAWSRYQ